jgi:RNA polymerase sigma-70 factor (ECF subfamily)
MKGNSMTLSIQDRDTAPVPDRDRFLQLLLPVKTHLYNFIRKTMNFSSEADDVFQDTLLKGFRYFHSFDRRRGFKTWIFTVAHNLVKDRFAAEARMERQAVSWQEAEEVEDRANTPDAQMTAEVRDIYRLAAALRPRHREVFFLYYYNEFSVAETAEITGLSRANVKFILHRARKRIKSIVEVSA